MYTFDENNALNNHLIIADEEEALDLGLLENNNNKKPEHIKNLEFNYNLKFKKYLATWPMRKSEYFNLNREEKEDILFIRKENDKVIAVTNVL